VIFNTSSNNNIDIYSSPSKWWPRSRTRLKAGLWKLRLTQRGLDY